MTISAPEQGILASLDSFEHRGRLIPVERFEPPGTAAFPPVLMLHGAADSVVPVSEARRLERLLRDRGLAHEMRIYAGQGHGFLWTSFSDACARAVAFLDRHLKR